MYWYLVCTCILCDNRGLLLRNESENFYYPVYIVYWQYGMRIRTFLVEIHTEKTLADAILYYHNYSDCILVCTVHIIGWESNILM